MAIIPLSSLLTSLTTEEAEDFLLDTAGTLGLNVTSWPAGGVARTIIAVFANLGSMVSEVIPEITRGGYRSLAEGSWLDLHGEDVYDEERIALVSGTCGVEFSNTSGTAYVVSPGDIVVAHGTEGYTYTLNEAGTIPAAIGMTPGTVTLDVIADVGGTETNASIGEINTMVTPLIGVTCSNVEDLAGVDQESDDDFRDRMGDSVAALSPNGPPDAYDYIARTTSVPVNRTKRIVLSGQVTLLVAKASGECTLDERNTIDEAIELNCVPIGVTANTHSAQENEIADQTTPFTATLVVYSDETKSDGTLISEARTALSAALSVVPIGGDEMPDGNGYVVLDKMRAVMRAVSEHVIDVQISNPPANVLLGVNEIPVVGDGNDGYDINISRVTS